MHLYKSSQNSHARIGGCQLGGCAGFFGLIQETEGDVYDRQRLIGIEVDPRHEFIQPRDLDGNFPFHALGS